MDEDRLKYYIIKKTKQLKGKSIAEFLENCIKSCDDVIKYNTAHLNGMFVAEYCDLRQEWVRLFNEVKEPK